MSEEQNIDDKLEITDSGTQVLADNKSEPSPEKGYKSSSKRIAKNAVALYIRMFITMIVGLYTSRVVLNTLGVEDFGIYGLVGSVLAMLGFLNASMSSATSRFLSFELGRGDQKRLAETFSSALIIHIFIALIVLILAETIGLWFLVNKLVIPPERMHAAHWVYQLTIASAMLGITQAPYGASIVSHEKMEVFAYFEIVNSLLRLGIVYLLVLGNFDKLILYGALSVSVSVLIRLAYRIYCIRHFQECRFHWVWKKSILKPLLNFSGWDLYGNGCVAIRAQGLNFLINIFFGVVYNAANSIALSVQGVFNHFVLNITQAFRPVIIKHYAIGGIKEMQQTMMDAIKLCTIFFSCVFFPLLLFLPLLLKIWLDNVPVHALEFSRLTLLHSVFYLITVITNIGIHSTGKVRRISFITGTLLLLNFPLALLMFYLGYSVDWTYYLLVGTSFIGVFLNSYILSCQIKDFKLFKYVLNIFRCFLFILLSAIPSLFFWKYCDETFINFLLLVVLTSLYVLAISYLLLLDKRTRALARNVINAKIRRTKMK
ncbi:MAG: polysaccharide biosynthesis protein [Muribaculaceae bacterium]|nr:polysaccharide biosynthesis protein [Muribaculaceae bacterium]